MDGTLDGIDVNGDLEGAMEGLDVVGIVEGVFDGRREGVDVNGE